MQNLHSGPAGLSNPGLVPCGAASSVFAPRVSLHLSGAPGSEGASCEQGSPGSSGTAAWPMEPLGREAQISDNRPLEPWQCGVSSPRAYLSVCTALTRAPSSRNAARGHLGKPKFCFHKHFFLCLESKSGHFETKPTLRMTLQAEKGVFMETNYIFSNLKMLRRLHNTEYSVKSAIVHTFATAVFQDKCYLKTQKWENISIKLQSSQCIMDLEKFGKCGDQLPNLEFLGQGCKVVLALVCRRSFRLPHQRCRRSSRCEAEQAPRCRTACRWGSLASKSSAP